MKNAPPITDPRSVPAPPMFGRVLRKDDALGLRETLLAYRMLTTRLPAKPRIHLGTGPHGSLTVGVQILTPES